MWIFHFTERLKTEAIIVRPEQADSLLGCCWGGWCGGPDGPRPWPRSGARGGSTASLGEKKKEKKKTSHENQVSVQCILQTWKLRDEDERACAGGPAESVTVVSSRRPSSIKPLERCPLSRFSALRAGDWGPPAWEMEDAARLSSMSWCMSTLVGHDCL